ncbi:Aspartic proteinase nepenthesin-1 [Triticum urartu]|uniref:Aspartic proteinase nepenthesin-1 n=1 Tax=Triticum urartu TaxID=4572 RepID=M7YLN7_TRIUA|nr:Aspartic proteinase nepenthesin-1 [Triticum urartu]
MPDYIQLREMTMRCMQVMTVLNGVSVCTSKDMPALQLLPYALFLTALLASSAAGHAAASLRAHLTHVDSGRGFTKHQLLRRMAARSLARIDSRCPAPGRGANAHPVTAPVSRGTVGIENMQSEYLVHFGIGTPRPQRVALTLDTGSDFVWTQCFCQGGLALSGCTARDNICFYTYFYGDNSISTGQIVEDTFTFQQAPNDGKVAAGDGSGGTMIDSGLSITKFPRAVFLSIVEEFKAQVPLPSDMVAGMLCFSAPHKKKAPAMPKMTLHLEDADWDLPRENYVLDLDGGDGDDDGTCVVIHAAGESGMTGIGNFQQQNTHVVYDLESNKLVFVPARCDKL